MVSEAHNVHGRCKDIMHNTERGEVAAEAY